MTPPLPDPQQFTPVAGSDARATPVRLLVVQGEARPAVDASDEPMVMTFPHLVLREAIAFVALSIVLITISLIFNAPLEEIANPSRTPNPAKAPWYFLGLQELLHYYPPLISGVVLPGILMVALIVIPYFDINLERAPLAKSDRRRTLTFLWTAAVVLTAIFYFTGAQPVWPLIGPLLLVAVAITVALLLRSSGGVVSWLRSRSAPFWIFAWFLLSAVALTVIGIFFRGPGWSFVIPWRDGIYY